MASPDITKPRRSLLFVWGNLLVGVRDALGNRVEESIASAECKYRVTAEAATGGRRQREPELILALRY